MKMSPIDTYFHFQFHPYGQVYFFLLGSSYLFCGSICLCWYDWILFVEQLVTCPQQNHFSIIFIDGTIDDIAQSKSIFVYEMFDDITWKNPLLNGVASSEELVGIGNDTGNQGAV